jgi:hypothetical protein
MTEPESIEPTGVLVGPVVDDDGVPDLFIDSAEGVRPAYPGEGTAAGTQKVKTLIQDALEVGPADTAGSG